MKYRFPGDIVGTRDARPPGDDVPAYEIEVRFDGRPDLRAWLPYGLNPVELGTKVVVSVEDAP